MEYEFILPLFTILMFLPFVISQFLYKKEKESKEYKAGYAAHPNPELYSDLYEVADIDDKIRIWCRGYREAIEDSRAADNRKITDERKL